MYLVWERLILFLLIVASISIFVRNLRIKLHPVLQGAPDRPRTDHPAARLKRTVREVLLQTRVIGGRRLVGVLHATVFFGFLLFALETVEHFSKGFGVSLLVPLLGDVLPYYRGLMVVVAIAVAVAITALAFRRFVLVGSSPDPKSWSSGVVALFILLLMLTYLNGLRLAPALPHHNYWVHALIILAFPHLIMKSKHFHILLAPISLFLRTEQLGNYAPIDLESLAASDVDEVTLGLENVASIPRKMRLDFLTCVECRRCTDNCPSALGGNDTNPGATMVAGWKALFSSLPDDPVVDNIVPEAALGLCATCGACENICPVGVEHLQLIVGAKRAQTLATGKGVVASEFFRAIESHGNAMGLPRSDRKARLKDLQLPVFSGRADEWLLWLGCVWGYNSDQRSAVRAFKEVLDQAGVRYGVLEDEPCCGHHSRRQGEESQFQGLARQSLELLEQKGVRRIVTPCPHCLHTLRHEHTQFNGHVNRRIVHHSEMLADLFSREALRLRPDLEESRTAVFHDPCYLARFERSWEASRAVLSLTGLNLRELPHRRDKTLCCGGGAAGFVRETGSAQRLDQPRRAEIKASGAPLLVTACPECRMMLDAAAEETRDIAEIVADAIRLPAVILEKGEPMCSLVYSEALAHRVLRIFEQCPGTELQLLNVAGRAHFSGKLSELRHAADHLVETGDLCLLRHSGARYYRLGRPTDRP